MSSHLLRAGLRLRTPAVTALAVLSVVVLALGLGRGSAVIWRVPVNERVIALTFDDGPHPEYTSRVLDELAARDIPATFFLIGSEAESYPDIVRRIASMGHEIGNHTYSHGYMEQLDAQSLAAEIADCEAAILAEGGTPTRWFRPPRGTLDLGHEWSVASGGRKIAMWTHCLESSDYRDPHVLAESIRPGDIVLVHDGRLDRTWSVEALPAFLDAALEKGYRFVTLTELEEQRRRPVVTGLLPGRP